MIPVSFDRYAPPPVGTVAPLPPRTLREMDTECYSNYWLCKFRDHATGEYHKVEMRAGVALDRAKLVWLLQTSTIVTFNGIKYDIPMIAAALAGYTNMQLKRISDSIIRQKMQPWQVEVEFGVTLPDFIDHIDLIEVLPGMANLKMYGSRMHCKTIQDLPIDPIAWLTDDQIAQIDHPYCSNDLIVTGGLYDKFKPEMEIRAALTAEYGIDLRSKSDAQIAEAIFKSQIPDKKMKPPHVPAGTQFTYKVAPFVKFRSAQLNDMLTVMSSLAFSINHNGSPSPHINNPYIDWGDKQLRQTLDGSWIGRPKGWQGKQIVIGSTVYQMGSGGLHSCEHNASHVANETYSLVDVDVVSYYPMIIQILRMFPPQIGELFLRTFIGWIKDRIAAKRAGNKRKANGAKTKINGTFGKTGSMYSILFAPEMMIRTTVTGQLCLLMLIEMLEDAGIAVVSANTDGVVIKCRRDMHGLRDMIISHWEQVTGFETEANEYRALFSRDVNSYMAFKMDDSVKLKGAFAPPEPVGPSWPNPSNEICVDAVIAYILNGVSLEKTIRACTDITKFVSVRNVKGGGCWVQKTVTAETVGAKRDALVGAGWTEVTKGAWIPPGVVAPPAATKDAINILRNEIPREYLGKTVRWYYGAGQVGHIAYFETGNLVARSEGAKPCMTLPDAMPSDINYDWYIREAQDLLKDLNIC